MSIGVCVLLAAIKPPITGGQGGACVEKIFYRGYVVEVVKKGVIVTCKNGVPFAAVSFANCRCNFAF